MLYISYGCDFQITLSPGAPTDEFVCDKTLSCMLQWSSAETQEVSGLSPLSTQFLCIKQGYPLLSLSPKDGKLCK